MQTAEAATSDSDAMVHYRIKAEGDVMVTMQNLFETHRVTMHLPFSRAAAAWPTYAMDPQFMLQRSVK